MPVLWWLFPHFNCRHSWILLFSYCVCFRLHLYKISFQENFLPNVLTWFAYTILVAAILILKKSYCYQNEKVFCLKTFENKECCFLLKEFSRIIVDSSIEEHWRSICARYLCFNNLYLTLLRIGAYQCPPKGVLTPALSTTALFLLGKFLDNGKPK